MGEIEERIAEKGLPGKFDYLEHPADVYIRAYGKDIIELFENSGLALFETMVDTSKVEPLVEKVIETEGFDLENLLYRWLEDLLTLYYSENLVFSEIIVKEIVIEKKNGDIYYRLRGLCKGEQYNQEKHEPRVEVKAVTYHLMKIVKDENEWRAYFVLDI
ncbi:archease [Desulfurococcaceae archaeon MEX13E-LK6-19]|nr:archease [Desulfurococcaceae archaeon MEX13E-LK6-19]